MFPTKTAQPAWTISTGDSESFRCEVVTKLILERSSVVERTYWQVTINGRVTKKKIIPPVIERLNGDFIHLHEQLNTYYVNNYMQISMRKTSNIKKKSKEEAYGSGHHHQIKGIYSILASDQGEKLQYFHQGEMRNLWLIVLRKVKTPQIGYN